MKRQFKHIIIATVLSAAYVQPAFAADTAPQSRCTSNIAVTVSGIKDIKGNISAALFKSAGDYQTNKAVRGLQVDVIADTVVLHYDGLPAGEYAIKLFHDVNGDGKLDTNLFGIPTEPFAFSNNAAGNMGPAKWSDAKFTTTAGDNTHAIILN